MIRNLPLALFVLGTTWVTGLNSAQAVAINSNLYCSAGANPAVNSDTSTATLATSDVKLTIGPTTFNSSNCYGPFSPANNGTATQTSDINDIYKGLGSAFVYLDRNDEAASPTGLGGITFTITSNDIGEIDGSFTVTWTDNAGGSDLPLTVDLVILLKAGPDAAAYLFDDLLLPIAPTSASGDFEIQFANPGGQTPELSHIFLAGRLQETTIEVPAPSALATVGASLLALGGLFRSRRRGA